MMCHLLQPSSQSVLVIAVLFGCIVTLASSHTTFTLVATPTAQDDLLCPGHVTFTCIAENVPRLGTTIGWFFNDDPVRHFEFQFVKHQIYPILLASDGTFTVLVESASWSYIPGNVNAIIDMTVDSAVLVEMNVSKLSCGRALNDTVQSFNIAGIYTQIPEAEPYWSVTYRNGQILQVELDFLEIKTDLNCDYLASLAIITTKRMAISIWEDCLWPRRLESFCSGPITHVSSGEIILLTMFNFAGSTVESYTVSDLTFKFALSLNATSLEMTIQCHDVISQEKFIDCIIFITRNAQFIDLQSLKTNNGQAHVNVSLGTTYFIEARYGPDDNIVKLQQECTITTVAGASSFTPSSIHVNIGVPVVLFTLTAVLIVPIVLFLIRLKLHIESIYRPEEYQNTSKPWDIQSTEAHSYGSTDIQSTEAHSTYTTYSSTTLRKPVILPHEIPSVTKEISVKQEKSESSSPIRTSYMLNTPLKTVYLTYTGETRNLVWTEYGFELKCHENGLRNTQQNLLVSVSAYTSGEFVFQEGYKLVSGVYQVTCDQPFPATIRIQHCASNLANLVFAVSSDKKPPFHFKILQNGTFVSNYGELKVSEFSRFSILWDWLFPIQLYNIILCHSNRPRYANKYKTWNVHFFAFKRLNILEELFHQYIDKLHESLKCIPVSIEFDDENEERLTFDYVKKHDLLDFLEYTTPLTINKSEIKKYGENTGRPPTCQMMIKSKDLNSIPFSVSFTIIGAKSPCNVVMFHWPIGDESSTVKSIPSESMDNSSSELSIDDLPDMLEKLYKARAKWYEIGLCLRVSVDTLEAIEKGCGDVDTCFREMLKHWLRQTDLNRSWSTLADVLKTKLVGYPDLGNRLV